MQLFALARAVQTPMDMMDALYSDVFIAGQECLRISLSNQSFEEKCRLCEELELVRLDRAATHRERTSIAETKIRRKV